MHPLYPVLLVGLLSVRVAAQTITLGAEDDAAPWSYANGSGYVNDLVRNAFAAVGWNVKYNVLPYARCKALTESGTLLGCFSSSRDQNTEQDMLFPNEPVFSAQNILFAPVDSTLEGCDPQRWGRKITVGFVNEYEYLPAVEALQKSGNITIELSISEVLNLRKLNARRLDAALITVDPVKRIELVAQQAKVTTAFKVVCDFGGAPAYVAFSKKHPQGAAALTAFNSGIALVIKNGTMARLQQQWRAKAIALDAAKIR